PRSGEGEKELLTPPLRLGEGAGGRGEDDRFETTVMANARALKFFDCNCAFGPYRTRVFRFARTADQLIGEMDFSNLERALVYHTAMRFDHPVVGNERVVGETRGHTRLLSTWALLPSQT